MLTNMTGREIKDMIENKMINIEALDVLSLEKLLDYETDLLCFGEGDMTLIRQCSRLLDEKSDVADDMDLDAVIARTRAEHVEIVPDKKRTPLRRFSLKRVLIIAAALIILSALAVTVIGESSLYRSVFLGQINGELSEVVVLSDGTVIEHVKYCNKYSTVAELQKGEKMDFTGVLYPTSFPDGYKQEYISYSIASDGTNLSFVTDNPFVNVGIFFDEDRFEISEYEEIYERNGVEYYIKKDNESPYSSPYFSVAFINGNYYSISAYTRDDIIYIIDNLQEIK